MNSVNRSLAPKNHRQRVSLLLPVICAVLAVMILAPVAAIFATAVMRGGKLDFAYALDTVADAENLRTIANTMILGAAVVSVSTVIALPLAFLLARTQFARRG
jgi:iron(III) transport system permease protein